MIYSEESERTFQKLKKFFQEFYPQKEEIDYDKYIKKLEIVETITKHRGGAIVLFDLQKLQIIHIIGNLSAQVQDLMSLQFFFHCLSEDHKTYPAIAVKWYSDIISKLDVNERKSLYINYCGMSVVYPSKDHPMRWNISLIGLDVEKDIDFPLVMVIVNDLTHLFKGSGYWFRASTNNGKVFSYFSEENQSFEEDILSNREKEIITYISQGLNTKKIADLLHISPNTVDNHRRNMIARTGAKNVTALIELCYLTGVL